jgi:transposase-like protein
MTVFGRYAKLCITATSSQSRICQKLCRVFTQVELYTPNFIRCVVEQNNRFIKKITKPMMGFKAFHSAKTTPAGIEKTHMIRKGQLFEENIPAYKQLALAG